MTRALVTCGGGFQGLGLANALRAAGARTYVCDVHHDNPTRYVAHDYLVCPPLSKRGEFESFLRDTITHEGIDCVFPATALDLLLLSRMQATLDARGTTVAVCRQPLLQQLLDKKQTLRFLAANDLPAAESIDPRQHDFAFPLLGKPAGGWGGRGFEILDSRQSMEQRLSSIDCEAYVWTRYIAEFEECSADFAIGADEAVSPIVVRKRLRTSGGFAVVSRSVQDPAWHSLFARVADALARAGGFGLFNVQAIGAEDGTMPPFVSDINPRMGTSATHALAEGINLPAWFVASARRHTPASTGSRRAAKSVRLLSDMILPVLPRRPRGIVFDLDDTLVDHRQWLLAKMQALYDACFRDLVGSDEYLCAVVQLIDDHEWAHLIDRTLELTELPPELRDRAIEAYRAIELPDTPMFDDVEPVLSALRGAGIRLAILTDNPPATQRSKISHAAPLKKIDVAVFSRECGGEKPNPAAFEAAANALSLPPDQLIMVGDNWMRDCEGAIRSGYAHAFAVRREGSLQGSLARKLQHGSTCMITDVPGLVPVQHACLDASA